MKIIVGLLLLLTVSFAKHECVHDEQDINLHFVDDGRSKEFVDPNNRVLADTYQSIRIHVDYNITEGSANVIEYIKNQLVPSAVKYYQDTLKVVRATAPLMFNTLCGDLAPPKYITEAGVVADLVILVTAKKSEASYLAMATPCALAESTSRPAYGMISFNMNHLPTSADADLEENLITTIHEMAHILGFSSSLYPYFINPLNNEKISPEKSKVVNGRTIRYLQLEPLTQMLRDYFDCQTLEGAYLENQGDSGSAGSHFERRIFFNEFMTASSISDSVISQFTLALLEGSGWYQVTYANAEPFSWGKGKGCSFLDTPCMNSTTPKFPDHFCGTLESQGCTFTGRAVAVCGTTDASVTASSMSSNLNYWSNRTVMLDSFSDNCPYFLGYPNLDCENPANYENAMLTDEKYGTTSRCFTGTLGKSGVNAQTGFCFPTQCINNGGSYTLRVTVGAQTVTCTSKGSQGVLGFAGQFNCPDPNDFCFKANPVYCERGCSGRGTCVNGVCQCPIGWGGADCALRIFAKSCSKCSSETENTACFGDGCACDYTTMTCSTNYNLIGVGDGGANRDGVSDDASRIGTTIQFIGLIMLAMLFF